MGTKGCANIKPFFSFPHIITGKSQKKKKNNVFLLFWNQAGQIDKACAISGLDLKDQGDKLLLAWEQIGGWRENKG